MTDTHAIKRFLEICLAITSERDRISLLTNILDAAIDIAHCDAGTLYLLEDNNLKFCRMQTRSLNIRQGGHDGSIELPPVPMKENYVCAWSALHKEAINIADVRHDERFDFSGAIQYDKLTGYKTVSMLVVPMLNDKGELIGVMQLINCLSEQGHIIAFAKEDEPLISAIASQAAISITNIQYAYQNAVLLDSLVQSLAKAVDERSAYTGNHTRNMVLLAERFINWLAATGNTWQFDEEHRKAFLMSIWLHDIGKLTIPLEVMDKATRLGDLLPEVMERIRVIGLLDRIAMLEGEISQTELDKRDKKREEIRNFILEIDKGKPLSEADKENIKEISQLTYRDEHDVMHSWITEAEEKCLLIERGTLTADERSTIESHVVMTKRILDQVAFPKAYSQVPVWASAHHEFLNGKGYPTHASDENIPAEARLLTILDVFEALTAKDRPYKEPKPVEQTLLVLEDMKKKGQIDAHILSLFTESKAWEGVL